MLYLWSRVRHDYSEVIPTVLWGLVPCISVIVILSAAAVHQVHYTIGGGGSHVECYIGEHISEALPAEEKDIPSELQEAPLRTDRQQTLVLRV